ncbi:uncharacterized protein LOC110907168 [Helianthus annuus]|uniref:uncharacterized protein LOC110907168 n=1 Tax=Helianthus annuus TaxID=4232 RepID=UPI000B906AB3|nr:uncharacterized protein LOC110907168 [Helianthus annuus]
MSEILPRLPAKCVGRAKKFWLAGDIVIIRFDVNTETFSEIGFPYVGNGETCQGNLVNMNNKLHVFVSHGFIDMAVDLWRYEDWGEVYEIDLNKKTCDLFIPSDWNHAIRTAMYVETIVPIKATRYNDRLYLFDGAEFMEYCTLPKTPPVPPLYLPLVPATLCGGGLYFVITQCHGRSDGLTVIRFDVNSKSFSELCFPNVYDDEVSGSLVNINEELHMYVCIGNYDYRREIIYVSEGVDMSAPISTDSESISSVPSHEMSASTHVECRKGRGRMGRPRLRERLPVLTPDVASSQRCSYVGSSSRNVVRYMRMPNENVQPSPITSISDSFAVIRTTQENISSNATTEVGRRRTGQMGRPRLRDRPSDLTCEATSTQRHCNVDRINRGVVHYTSRTNGAVQSSLGSTVSQTSGCLHSNQVEGLLTLYLPFLGRCPSYYDIGDANHSCVHCGAMLCEGKVCLPFLRHPPQTLGRLLDYNGESRSRVFRENIKLLNAMFAFTSTCGRISTDLNDGRGPYTFRLNGHNHHNIGSLLPMHPDGRPRFAQLYVYDTENETDNRFYALRNCVSPTSDQVILRTLVNDFLLMLDANNALVQAFRMARERFNDNSMQRLTLRLLGTRNRREGQYSLPTVPEVAALIPGDGNPADSRDIIIEERGSRSAKRISELHPSFMALQQSVSLREYYSYRLQLRRNEAILEHEMNWFKQNQNTIRSDLYNGLYDRIADGETSCEAVGRRVILPATFAGGPRYMIQQYQDAMAICRWAGAPDLFITMTCNSKWPEITRHIQATTPGMSASDRPDIVARVFKIKLDELIKDIRKRNIFGHTKAVIYTIEFQKRGLPHSHILLFLQPEDKINTVDNIDKYISAELPSEVEDPIAFGIVRTQMMHGPCGLLNPSSPCMHNDVCSKGYPKNYCEETFIRNDGWLCYKRPNNSRVVKVGSQDIK